MDKNLLEIVNELQEVITKYKVKQEIDLPEVLVIGSQSVGKSSLLELLINLQFLPKGEGIVTRCPLIIQVVKDSSIEKFEASFTHCPERTFTTEKDIQQEILNQTIKIAGNRKGVSKESIILKMRGPEFFTMSYVDLPGLTKIPTNEQPEDIETQIRELCKSYAINPNSIILALSASNQDIVNSESLKFAMKIDPKGERTISVITKTDLFDGSNTYLTKLFKKNLINLEMGFVATSSMEFEKNDQNVILLKQKFQALQEFNNFGRDILLKKLSKILRQKIKKTLPHVRQNLHELLSNLKAQQNSILIQKDLDNLDIKGKGILMLNYINRFVQDATKHLQGESFEVGMTLQGAAKINEIIDQNFRKEILAMNVLDVVKEEDIYIAVKNANGFKPSLFVSQKAFETLCKHMIQKLKPISLDCSESVSLELLQLFHNIQIQEIQLFKELQTEILTIVDELIKQRLLPTKEFIEKFFEIETGFINTKHPDFLDTATQSINYQDEDEYQESEFMKKIPKREKNEIELIKKMLYNYFEVVKKNISDYIPKIILTLLVQKTIKDCETELIEKLYKPERIEILIKENDESIQKKLYLNEQVQQIQKCLKNLNSFNQIQYFIMIRLIILTIISCQIFTFQKFQFIKEDEGSSKCSAQLLQIYLPPRADFQEDAQKPSDKIRDICPHLDLTCCNADELTNLRNDVLKTYQDQNEIQNLFDQLFTFYKTFDSKKLKEFLISKNFDAEAQKCMGYDFSKLPDSVDTVDKEIDQQNDMLKDIQLQKAKYYSSVACELCHPRLTDAVDIENGQIKRVRHDIKNFAMIVHIMQKFVKNLDFYYSMAYISKAGLCHDKQDVSWFTYLDQLHQHLPELKQLLLACTKEEYFDNSCMMILQYINVYDTDMTFQMLIQAIEKINDGLNILQRQIYPQKSDNKIKVNTDGVFVYFKRSEDQKLDLNEGSYLVIDQSNLQIYKNEMKTELWNSISIITRSLLLIFLTLQLY